MREKRGKSCYISQVYLCSSITCTMFQLIWMNMMYLHPRLPLSQLLLFLVTNLFTLAIFSPFSNVRSRPVTQMKRTILNHGMYYPCLLNNEHLSASKLQRCLDSHILSCPTVSDAKGHFLPTLLLAHTERWEDRVSQVRHKPCLDHKHLRLSPLLFFPAQRWVGFALC